MIKINKSIVRLALTALGMIGVPVTSMLSIKCHEKAKTTDDKKEKVKAYIPAIVSGVVTCGCIGMSHKVGTKEIAALTATATYAITNRNMLEEKLSPYISKEEAKEIKTEVAKKIPSGPSIEWTGNGTLKFLEGYSGRLFYSNLESVLSAERKLNNRLSSGDYVCLNDFYEYLNIETTHFGNQWGWVPDEEYYKYNVSEPIEFRHTMVEDTDGEPLCLIDVYTYPMEGWMEV